MWGSPPTGAKLAFDVGIVEPNSISHSARSGCNQSSFNVNDGTVTVARDEEREKVKRYKVLCNQRGLTFVPIIFTTCGAMGEAFQRQIWPPHWKRVEAEDAEMKITGSEWVSRKRLNWQAIRTACGAWQFGLGYQRKQAIKTPVGQPDCQWMRCMRSKRRAS